jgi:hypothetical protein
MKKRLSIRLQVEGLDIINVPHPLSLSLAAAGLKRHVRVQYSSTNNSSIPDLACILIRCTQYCKVLWRLVHPSYVSHVHCDATTTSILRTLRIMVTTPHQHGLVDRPINVHSRNKGFDKLIEIPVSKWSIIVYSYLVSLA